MNEMELRQLLTEIRPLDEKAMAAVQTRLDQQTKPQGSLGRLEEFACRFVAITGREDIRAKRVYTFAGDHGIAEEGVSAFPKEVTQQMVLNFVTGGAAINALARHAGADVKVVDMGVDADFELMDGLLPHKVGRGTANFSKGPAMTREQALQCLTTGITLARQAKEEGIDLLATGEMGIANTTPSAAIAAIFTGLTVEQVTFRGTGIDDKALQHKVAVIRKGLEVNQPEPTNPLDVLAKVGGFEIGGIAGLVLGAALYRIPVVIDGFISTAGALIASELHPHVRDYLFAAHRSVEIGHVHMLERIGQRPMLDLDLRLGEGTGAALAMPLIEASLQGLREIRTFAEAGVSEGSNQ